LQRPIHGGRRAAGKFEGRQQQISPDQEIRLLPDMRDAEQRL